MESGDVINKSGLENLKATWQQVLVAVQMGDAEQLRSMCTENGFECFANNLSKDDFAKELSAAGASWAAQQPTFNINDAERTAEVIIEQGKLKIHRFIFKKAGGAFVQKANGECVELFLWKLDFWSGRVK